MLIQKDMVLATILKTERKKCAFAHHSEETL